jgi:hypothetical protein
MPQLKNLRATRAAVITSDPDAPILVAFGVNGTKPVHFLSMVCTVMEKMSIVSDAQRRISSFL